MSNVNEVVVRYLAAWNEREPKKRRELVAKTWADDGTYVDAARDGKGHDSLDAMIAAAQGHFPGYRLNLASGIEVHHDYLRFSWAAGGCCSSKLPSSMTRAWPRGSYSVLVSPAWVSGRAA